MAKYMIQASYSAEAWAAQIKNPMNRMEVVGKQMAAMGCKLIDGYMTFGDSDLVIIVDAPDNITAAGMLIKVASSGALDNVSTTVLLDMNDAVAAINKAGEFDYTPPGK